MEKKDERVRKEEKIEKILIREKRRNRGGKKRKPKISLNLEENRWTKLKNEQIRETGSTCNMRSNKTGLTNKKEQIQKEPVEKKNRVEGGEELELNQTQKTT